MESLEILINSLSEEIARARKAHRMYYNGESGSGDQDHVDDQIKRLANQVHELTRIRLELEELFYGPVAKPEE